MLDCRKWRMGVSARTLHSFVQRATEVSTLLHGAYLRMPAKPAPCAVSNAEAKTADIPAPDSPPRCVSPSDAGRGLSPVVGVPCVAGVLAPHLSQCEASKPADFFVRLSGFALLRAAAAKSAGDKLKWLNYSTWALTPCQCVNCTTPSLYRREGFKGAAECWGPFIPASLAFYITDCPVECRHDGSDYRLGKRYRLQ